MTKILIPIDGSKASIRALDYVVKRKRGGEAIQSFILNVQIPISPRGNLVTRSMIRDYQLHVSDEILKKSEVQTRKRFLEADTYMEIGDPAATIIGFAHKTKCQEIVIGSRGLGGLKGVLLGSVANKVVHASPIPVVVVK